MIIKEHTKGIFSGALSSVTINTKISHQRHPCHFKAVKCRGQSMKGLMTMNQNVLIKYGTKR